MSQLYTTQELIDAVNERYDHAYTHFDVNLAWEYAMVTLYLESGQSVEKVLEDLQSNIEELEGLTSFDCGNVVCAKKEVAEYLSTFLIRTVDAY